MTSMEPSEGDIANVMEVTMMSDRDRDLAIRALKFRQKYESAWDDSMFTADRDGTDNSAGISFHIEASDNGIIQGVTPPPDAYAPGAPSRPPSRSNNRSPLGRMVDWTAAHVPGIAHAHAVDNALTRTIGVPNSHAQEEDEIQRAIRESAQEAGITLPEHESGITEPSASAPHFGPANRSDYDQNSWALIPLGPAEASSANEPLPSQRKRGQDAPAMVVLSDANAGDHKLGGIVTILHEIPIARNALLGIGKSAASYGHRSDWWNGKEILSPEVLSKMSSELRWNDQEDEKIAFVEEVHRLMAFLDSTERGYGSVAVLTDLLRPSRNGGIERQFFELLTERFPDPMKPVVQIAALARFHGDSLGYDEARFGILEMEQVRTEYSGIKTLYEALDHVMWSDTLGWDEIRPESKMAFFKEMGEVLVLNISGDGPEDSIEIPAELYPERYLTTRKDEARRLQYGWCDTKREINRLMGEKDRIYQLQNEWKNDKFKDKRDLIKKASEQWAEYKNYLESLARFQAMEKSGFDTDKYPDYRAAPCDMDDKTQQQHHKVDEVIRFSGELLANLEERVKGLDAELEQIKAKQRALGRLLTVPDKPGRPKPMTCKKYLLRGVATAPHIIYVCQREEADLIDLDAEERKPSDQWWRLEFTPKEDEAVKAEKIEIERVFRDMWLETKKPLLVYATEEALSTPKQPLSSQLERFVKAENKAFRQELNQEKAEEIETRRATFVDPISPSKRKHRSPSAGSMDSNRASIGSDDRNGFDNPFADQDAQIGTEMTDFASDTPEYVHSFDAPEEKPPALPARQPVSAEGVTETPSATMTPNTVAADRTEDASPAKEEPRSPEMQERARPPPFMTLSKNPSTAKETIDLMDMEIPEHQ
ncbi:hypothetical protein ACJ41O_013309 [Fusarium nematophilum]